MCFKFIMIYFYRKVFEREQISINVSGTVFLANRVTIGNFINRFSYWRPWTCNTYFYEADPTAFRYVLEYLRGDYKGVPIIINDANTLHRTRNLFIKFGLGTVRVEEEHNHVFSSVPPPSPELVEKRASTDSGHLLGNMKQYRKHVKKQQKIAQKDDFVKVENN